MEVGDTKNRQRLDVKLLLGVLIVVPLPLESHTDPSRQVLDAEFPDLLVELGVDPDVVDAHRLLCKLDDLLDGLGRTLLKLHVVHPLVEVDCVLPLQSKERRRVSTQYTRQQKVPRMVRAEGRPLLQRARSELLSAQDS